MEAVGLSLNRQEDREVLKRAMDASRRLRQDGLRVGMLWSDSKERDALCRALFACGTERQIGGPRSLPSGTDVPAGLELVDLNASLGGEKGDDPCAGLDLLLWLLPDTEPMLRRAEGDYRRRLCPRLGTRPLLLVMTGVERLEPVDDWDEDHRMPGNRQLSTLLDRMLHRADLFRVPASWVVPLSLSREYNLPALVARAVDYLPDDRKHAFIRHVNPRWVTDEVRAEAERGVLETVADELGEALERVAVDYMEWTVKALRPWGQGVVLPVLAWFGQRIRGQGGCR